MVQWLRLHTGHHTSNASIGKPCSAAKKVKKTATTDLICKVQEMAQTEGEVGKADP